MPNVRPLTHRETIRRPAPTAAELPLLDASTLDWMLETAFGGAKEATQSPANEYGYAFRPPPRFEVDAAGGWSPHPQTAQAHWNNGEGQSEFQWNGGTTW